VEIGFKPSGIKQLIKKYKGVLLIGNKALQNYLQVENALDIVEEWWSQKGLPYIHSVLAARKIMIKSVA
jgi:predicted solute-binding protein